jgi:hypothetical protein
MMGLPLEPRMELPLKRRMGLPLEPRMELWLSLELMELPLGTIRVLPLKPSSIVGFLPYWSVIIIILQ